MNIQELNGGIFHTTRERFAASLDQALLLALPPVSSNSPYVLSPSFFPCCPLLPWAVGWGGGGLCSTSTTPEPAHFRDSSSVMSKVLTPPDAVVPFCQRCQEPRAK